MRRLSNTFQHGTVTFLPLADSTTDGAPDPTYGTPVPVAANVQGWKGRRFLSTGVDEYEVEFTVTLMDDPSALNGGAGVKRGDVFVWSLDGRYMVARHDAVQVGSTWPVRCLVNQ